MSGRVLANTSAVAIAGRVLLIEGPPASGKSSLALALIDRGAELVGDDAVQLQAEGDRLLASAPPNTQGLIEIRNVGIAELPVAQGLVALLLSLDPKAPRFPMELASRTLEGVCVPVLPFAPGDALQAIRAEYALAQHGLPLPKPCEKA